MHNYREVFRQRSNRISIHLPISCVYLDAMNLEDTNQEKTQADLLTDLIKVEQKVFSNSRKLFFVGLIALFMALNLFLAYKTLSNHSKNPVQAGQNRQDEMIGASLSIFLALPIAAFVLALLLSLIPYKKIKYSKKYLPFAIITLLILQILQFLLILAGIPMNKG